ncbi:hypothetical protein TorRG33x02_037780 [Trema orientale]|uniref:Uncharacterized protein n=1 Tax=Trema orientale TaxID=63057 RepID=A0A2P5FRD3_TREOI|nr:hypothetical protein TorRG33x02_037780 [Trema orientale]
MADLGFKGGTPVLDFFGGMESFSEQFPSTSSPHATDQGQQSNTLASNYSCKDFGDFAPLCNLEELVYMYSELIALSDRSEVTRRDMDRLELLKKSLGDIKLTKSGRPTFLLLELMR